MSTYISMHRLTRISLINWYLFEKQDIDIDEDSILFRGRNGSGKSSLIDAIQTVFAGGNENALQMNAAISTSKGTGRTIKSYALGIVDESQGAGKIEARTNSNSYICLSFRTPEGGTYSIGLSMYARASDPKVIKHYFIINNAALSTVDFLESEYTVLTWTGFERRLKTEHPLASFPKSSKDFRYRYCELMSAPGTQFQIEPDIMWRAFKNGVAFKEQKDIAKFTRDYILPPNPIDVNMIENDYKDYRDILELIKRAENELKALDGIITKYKTYESKHRRSTSLQWSKYEALFSSLDLAISSAAEKQAEAEDELVNKDIALTELSNSEPDVSKKRDYALTAFQSSSVYDAEKNFNEAITQSNQTIKESKEQVDHGQSLLASLLSLQPPASSSAGLKDAFAHARKTLSQACQFEKTDMIQSWPRDEDHVDEMLSAISSYQDLAPIIQRDRDSLHNRHEQAKEEFSNLKNAVKRLQAGQAQLMEETDEIISILAKSGIEAKPVCDLCTITNDEWQKGVEGFLGTNREALVIESADYAQALSIYRNAINSAPNKAKLRRVKLINPDKQFGFDGEPEPGSAAAIIASDNTTARKYLRGLLRNVRLVNTEKELRREHRAITKDAMVAANGAISGGNTVRFVLIGQEARRKHAEDLAGSLQAASTHLVQVHSAYDPLNALNQSFPIKLAETIAPCIELKNALTQADAARLEIVRQNKLIAELKDSPEQTLKDDFVRADKRLKDLQASKTKIEIRIAELNTSINQVKTVLPGLQTQLTAASENREQCESRSVYNSEDALKMFEALSEEFGDDNYDDIRHAADDRAASAFEAANKAKDAASLLKRDYMHDFDPHNKEDLKDASPSDSLRMCQMSHARIESAQITGYKVDAEEACEKMLDNFRSEVVAKLKENFQRIDRTFSVLNGQLKSLKFNNNTYKFEYPIIETEVLKQVYEFVSDSSDLDSENVGSLFDDKKEHPAVEIIQEVLTDGRLDEISDYRNFFTYDIIATDTLTQVERHFSKLLLKGSGGEKQTPFYVALGAAFMSAYRIQKIGDNVNGGAALAIFDEAFNNMDESNAHAALNFFREIGLQVILAAPPDSEVKIGACVDRVYNVLRTGRNVYLDHRVYTDAGKELLESDDPQHHPELVDALMPEVEAELTCE